jgi:hypothetical protein
MRLSVGCESDSRSSSLATLTQEALLARSALPLSVYRAVQPEAEQTIRVGGSAPRLTMASTGPRPCVLKAWRVSMATEPFASWFIAAR